MSRAILPAYGADNDNLPKPYRRPVRRSVALPISFGARCMRQIFSGPARASRPQSARRTSFDLVQQMTLPDALRSQQGPGSEWLADSARRFVPSHGIYGHHFDLLVGMSADGRCLRQIWTTGVGRSATVECGGRDQRGEVTPPSAPQSPAHRRPRSRGIEPCFRVWGAIDRSPRFAAIRGQSVAVHRLNDRAIFVSQMSHPTAAVRTAHL